MRRLECARPARTAIGQARNAGEAVQQLAHLSRERQRVAQERVSLIRRIRKLDARLVSMTALESKLLPMIRQEAGRSTAAPSPQSPPPAAAVAPAPPAAPVRRHAALPIGLSEVTLQY